MYPRTRVDDPIGDLARSDGRYSSQAFRFLFESLEQAIKLAGKDEETGVARHVTGQEVLNGMRENASTQFGPLAAQVWRSWGINEALDWGRIVFLLVEAGLLNRQESDTIEDFRDGFDFDEAFVRNYEPPLSALKEELDPE